MSGSATSGMSDGSGGRSSSSSSASRLSVPEPSRDSPSARLSQSVRTRRMTVKKHDAALTSAAVYRRSAPVFGSRSASAPYFFSISVRTLSRTSPKTAGSNTKKPR